MLIEGGVGDRWADKHRFPCSTSIVREPWWRACARSEWHPKRSPMPWRATATGTTSALGCAALAKTACCLSFRTPGIGLPRSKSTRSSTPIRFARLPTVKEDLAGGLGCRIVAGVRGRTNHRPWHHRPRTRWTLDVVWPSSASTEGDPEHQAIFWADVVPTTHHIQPPYIMAYDLNAEWSYRGAKRVVGACQ